MKYAWTSWYGFWARPRLVRTGLRIRCRRSSQRDSQMSMPPRNDSWPSMTTNFWWWQPPGTQLSSNMKCRRSLVVQWNHSFCIHSRSSANTMWKSQASM